jgi:L-fuconolactonase
MVTQAWYKLTKEDPLEPELPICDPHHHLWDYPDDFPESRVPTFARLVRHNLLKDLLEDLSCGHNIDRTVFIECSSQYRKDGPPEMSRVGETEFVNGIAAQAASGQYGNAAVAAGIIGSADLTLGSGVSPVLEAHIAASQSRFRGIRFIATWDASPDVSSRVKNPKLLADPEFRQGFSCLDRYHLSFESWLYHTQLVDLVDLAKAFPYTPIVLNHIGGPIGIGPYAGKREEVFQTWKQGIAALAACPNVVVKLGGVGMPMMGFGWHERPTPPGSVELAQKMAPYFTYCIEKLGANRCMFESNFPVDRTSFSYTVIWNAFKRFSQDFSPSERAALFHDHAVRVYRLESNY